jgi:50S ribosomal subunit-associated GTPase HflX
MQTTLTVLGELGADEKEILTVFNKIDLLKKGRPRKFKI